MPRPWRRRAIARWARHITDHERALLEFVDRELAGRASESAQPVLAFLVNPPQPPDG